MGRERDEILRRHAADCLTVVFFPDALNVDDSLDALDQELRMWKGGKGGVPMLGDKNKRHELNLLVGSFHDLGKYTHDLGRKVQFVGQFLFDTVEFGDKRHSTKRNGIFT